MALMSNSLVWPIMSAFTSRSRTRLFASDPQFAFPAEQRGPLDGNGVHPLVKGPKRNEFPFESCSDHLEQFDRFGQVREPVRSPGDERTTRWHGNDRRGRRRKNHLSAVRADGSGKVVWENSSRVYVPSMLVRDGHLYSMLDAGIAMCWKCDTGAKVWEEFTDPAARERTDSSTF